MGCAFCKRSKKIVKYDTSGLSPDWQITMLKDVDSYRYMKQDECDILFNKWRHLMESPRTINLGNTVFSKFFLYAPDAQKLFFPGSTRIRSTYEWQRHPLFMSHVRRVISGIDTAVALINYPQDLAHHLNRIRKVHYRYSELRLLYAEIFIKVFEDCVAEALGETYTNDCKNAFRKFLTMLYSILFHDLDRMKRHRSFGPVSVSV